MESLSSLQWITFAIARQSNRRNAVGVVLHVKVHMPILTSGDLAATANQTLTDLVGSVPHSTVEFIASRSNIPGENTVGSRDEVVVDVNFDKTVDVAVLVEV